MRDLKIVFMGTPDFAVPSLEILVDSGFDIVGVITAPDRPKGRGRSVQMSPVKEYAQSKGLKVMQPSNLKSPEFLHELKSTGVNLQVVVAFRMLPESVWSYPEYGTFNLHASLLPNYRGAAPINWAIINGEKVTGVTTFFLKHEIDTGNILLQEEIEIGFEDNAGILHDKCMHIGAKLVQNSCILIQNEEEKPQPQVITGNEKEAPKIFKETCEINWEQPVEDVYNFIRGLSPYPGAWTEFKGTTYKIFKSKKAENYPGTQEKPGILRSNGTGIFAFSSNGVLEILEIQAPGKRKMTAKEFLAGNTI